MQINRVATISRGRQARVSRETIRAYVIEFIRVCMVMDICQPGHPWFEHQMGRHVAAARLLKQELTAHGMRALPFIRRYAKMEARARLIEYGVTASVYSRVTTRVEAGELPLVTTDKPI